MTVRQGPLAVAVDARSLLCAEPRGEGKSLLRLYQEIAGIDGSLRAVFFGDEQGHKFQGELPRNTEVRLLGSRGARFNAWENLRFPLAAVRAGCNVLHGTSSGGPFWPLRPLLVTVHDLIPMLVDDGQSARDKQQFARRLARSVEVASAVIAVSDHTRRDLVNAYRRFEPKFSVVHWGAPERHPARSPRGGGATLRPYALAFGGTAPRKNTVYTLERFAAVARALPLLDLVFVGISSQAQRKQIEDLAATLGVAGRLRMPGFVDEAELNRLLGDATMVLYLSRYEGFGVPLLEAVAHGVPVIASDASSIPEVLGDAQSCHALSAPAAIENDIVRLACDPQERAARIAAQAAGTARFAWRRTAEQTLGLLRTAAGHRG